MSKHERMHPTTLHFEAELKEEGLVSKYNRLFIYLFAIIFFYFYPCYQMVLQIPENPQNRTPGRKFPGFGISYLHWKSILLDKKIYGTILSV